MLRLQNSALQNSQSIFSALNSSPALNTIAALQRENLAQNSLLAQNLVQPSRKASSSPTCTTPPNVSAPSTTLSSLTPSTSSKSILVSFDFNVNILAEQVSPLSGSTSYLPGQPTSFPPGIQNIKDLLLFQQQQQLQQAQLQQIQQIQHVRSESNFIF